MSVVGAAGRERHIFAYERVLLYLAACKMPVRMSIRELANALEVKQRTLKGVLQYLRKRNLVISSANHDPNGAQLVNTYALTRAGADAAAAISCRIERNARDAWPSRGV